MSIVRLEDVPAGFGPCALSIGVFDGVHLGHQSLLGVLKAEAARAGVRSAVLTFDRHPQSLLAPQKEPPYINTLEQKLELLESCGVDSVVVAQFGHQLADLSPEQFLDRVVVQTLGAVSVVVGSNFKFGKARAGDIQMLQDLCAERGMQAISVEPMMLGGGPVSSTRVRRTIERGDISAAARLLGRPFRLLGTVVQGLQLGRQLGYPTANMQVSERQLVPPFGVYAVEAMVGGKSYAGACSIGTRPTIEGTERAIEVLIDGFSGNLYGTSIAAAFHRRLRDQRKFGNLEELKCQIARDVEKARDLLQRRPEVTK